MMNTSILSFSGHALCDIPTKTIKPWLLAIEASANQVGVAWSKGRHHSFKARLRASPMLAVICGLQYEDTKLSQVILHVANALGLWSPQHESPSCSTSHNDQRCGLCHPDDLVDASSVGNTSFPSEALEGYTCPQCT